ncbi:glycerophosphodiester phosphodiesterase [Bacillus lacus]|uniref:Glycerophosphodiester phosphodiesterase n=1 Tax=Metabacillus lacus TaxID=1983721 RepID=A0A7X2J289_9BACI|nr:glycerophosphodiester phosphodiesterase [Metabacillus lacus]MRX74065.1 glycerophosphodiester phosphodiesterase [Metabacillus lacus]
MLKKSLAGILVAAALVTGIVPGFTAHAAPQKVDIVAHRGASGYAPENTMAAFEKAVKMKADFVEVDVQMSKDGELVLIHDVTVDRTTDGSGHVADLTYQQLRKLDAGSWFGSEFTGERIPTLDELLDKYRGKTGLLIELKAPWLYPGIEEKVAEALKKRNMHKPKNGKIIVQSFDFQSMKTFHQLLPQIPVGLLIYLPQDLTDEALIKHSHYASYVNPSLNLVNKDLVNKVHTYGMKIQSWTVRNPEQVQPLLDAGVDGIITDFPDYVPRNLKRKK